MYEINTPNENFIDLPLDGNQRFIAGRRIYFVNGDIVYGLNNGSIVDIYMNQI